MTGLRDLVFPDENSRLVKGGAKLEDARTGGFNGHGERQRRRFVEQ